MENIVKRKKILSATASLLVIAAGAVLLAASLRALPGAPAHGFPWEFLGAVISLVVIAAGGAWMGSILRGRSRGGHELFDRHGMIIVIFVIIAGIILMCFNFGVLPAAWRPVFFSWQMLLIALGAAELSRARLMGGGILLAVGGFFILRPLAAVYPAIDATGSVGAMYWPALLIAIGILLLFGMIFGRRGRADRGCRKELPRSEIRGGSGLVDISVVFGSSEQIVLDPVFRGGRISSVFGGVVLDLRRTELPEGDTFLKIESVFGGTEVYAPEGWTIELRNESVFGGFADKRPQTDRTAYGDGRRLIIKASNVFGGGEIK